jgi:uncharacterized membrane protein
MENIKVRGDYRRQYGGISLGDAIRSIRLTSDRLNWHQRQQRARASEDAIPSRIADVNEFYLTSDIQLVKDIIYKYAVRYIIVGQLERALYPGLGLDKFEQLDGVLWKEVFRVGETVIYEVVNQQ